jgi:hypothetical protein
MLKQYVFTVEEINKIGELLGECPVKFGMPVIDYLRDLMIKKDESEKAVEAGNEMSQ